VTVQRNRYGRLGATLGLQLLASVVTQGEARAQAGSPFRYDDDVSEYASPSARVNLYDELKYVPLGDAAGEYLSFGADLRERVEVNSNALLGYGNKGPNAYDLHRLLLFADVRYDGFQVFVQLGNETEAGRAPGPLPTDIDRGDLAQGFMDYAFAAGPGNLTIRGGRFEMAYDEGALIGLRDGPNVRQVWDGCQLSYVLPEARIDAFLVKPVNVSPGYVDDRTLAGQTLWGMHLSASPALIAPLKITAFYYGNTMPDVAFYPRSGKEQTHSVGLRLLASAGSLDGSIGGIGQVGTLASRNVLAWAAHVDAGWTIKAPWTARLGLRSDILSGGGEGGTVHTFNALYPNYAYSTEATIEAPANLLQVGTTLGLHPLDSVTVNYTLEAVWRYSIHDAFYAAPTFALVLPSGSSRRFSGVEQQVEATWRINTFLDLTAAYVHFEPSAFLRSAHARSQEFGMTAFSVHL
jgi:hypothetical protein